MAKIVCVKLGPVDPDPQVAGINLALADEIVKKNGFSVTPIGKRLISIGGNSSSKYAERVLVQVEDLDIGYGRFRESGYFLIEGLAARDCEKVLGAAILR